jgi:hypothetical protein
MEQNTTLCSQCTCVDCAYRRDNPPWRGRVVYWGLVALLCAAIAYTYYTTLHEIPIDSVERKTWKRACGEMFTLGCMKMRLGVPNVAVALLKLILLLTIGCCCCTHAIYPCFLLLDLVACGDVLWNVGPSMSIAISPRDVLTAVPVLVPPLLLWASVVYVEWIVTYRTYCAPNVDSNKKES